MAHVITSATPLDMQNLVARIGSQGASLQIREI